MEERREYSCDECGAMYSIIALEHMMHEVDFCPFCGEEGRWETDEEDDDGDDE